MSNNVEKIDIELTKSCFLLPSMVDDSVVIELAPYYIDAMFATEDFPLVVNNKYYLHPSRNDAKKIQVKLIKVGAKNA